MSGGWNARPEDRRAAKRMWHGGLPRKRIAAILGVSEHTVSKWCWQDGWPNRRRYVDRPIVAAKQPRLGPTDSTLRRCPVCQGTEDLSAPHRHGEAA